MNTALICDLHIGARNDNQIFHEHFEGFYTNTFFPYLDAHKISRCVILGDLFCRQKYVNYNTLAKSRRYLFDPLKERGIEVDMILGNHDCFYRNTLDVNSPELLLGEYDNFTIYKEPTEVMLGDTKVLYLPWICAENQERCLDAILNTDALILFAHIDVIGFDLGGGRLQDNGFQIEDFDKFELVYTGHYHKMQQIQNIKYLGAPYEMNWGDYNQTKGFHVFEPKTRALTHIRNPDKIFYKLHYNDGEKTPKEIMGTDMSMLENAYVKVIVRCKDDPDLYNMFIDKLNKAQPADVSVVDDHYNQNAVDDLFIVDQAEDTLTIMRKYIENMHKAESLNAEYDDLDSYMFNVYKKAMDELDAGLE